MNLDVTYESFFSQLDQRSFESRHRIDKNNKLFSTYSRRQYNMLKI